MHQNRKYGALENHVNDPLFEIDTLSYLWFIDLTCMGGQSGNEVQSLYCMNEMDT